MGRPTAARFDKTGTNAATVIGRHPLANPMRALGYTLGLIVIATFFFAAAPSASAAAYCVEDVKNTYPHDDCDGVACLGYNQDGWQYCAPSNPICEFQSDCCYSTPGGEPFYCPDES